jgi:hypothetical protein
LLNLPISPEHVSPFSIGSRWASFNDLGNPIVHAMPIFTIPLAPTVFGMAVCPTVLTKFIGLKGNEKYGR